LGPEPVEILALDLAGHGTSDHRTSEDYALWRYIEDADQIVEQLGWQRHAIIGHSMGGAISTLYAGLFESRYLIHSIILNLSPNVVCFERHICNQMLTRTLYIYPLWFRVTLCVLLDNMGPLTRSVEDQPQHLLEHIADKKNLLTKRSAFHPTVESACQARSQGGAYGIAPEFAELLMPRGLRPAEKTLEDGKTVIQGWTWSTDRLLTIRSAQSMSEAYAKAFMTRITCPVFAVMAEEGLFHLKDGKSKKKKKKKKGEGEREKGGIDK
jgi:pimeloyl-ACP methyl ester carboxylesterase